MCARADSSPRPDESFNNSIAHKPGRSLNEDEDTSMLKRSHLCTAIVTVLCLLLLSCVSSSTNQGPANSQPSPAATPVSSVVPTTAFGRSTGNKHFTLNKIQTTPYGP